MALRNKNYLKIKIPQIWKSEKIHTKRIPPMAVRPGRGIKGLVELYSSSGCFQAGRLATGCKIYQRMINENAGIALTLAGAMTPTGMGGIVAQMIEHGAIDWIIATGANVFHDLHYALELPVHQGDFRVNDAELKEKNIDRIYDIFLTEEVILRTDIWLLNALKPVKNKKLSTAEIHHILGQALLKDGADPGKSMVAAAAQYGVPIYTSSPGDSEIGLNLAYTRLRDDQIILDPLKDVIETTAIVNYLAKNGVVIVGGGSPKNFYLQTQPMLRTWCNIDRKGHDYDIQIAVDSPHWGGLSGATPEEAVSWGKIKPDRLVTSVVIYSDATIAVPILFGYILETTAKRKHKRLFDKIPGAVSRLKKQMTDLDGLLDL